MSGLAFVEILRDFMRAPPDRGGDSIPMHRL